jgi:hypothetical protein
MGAALEVITGQVSSPNTTLTQLVANSGSSYAVRATDPSANIQLLNAWAFTATAGVLRVRSPRMHDQAQNTRFQTVASIPRPVMALGESQELYSQDNIIVEMTGDSAAVDMASLLVYYASIPGLAANLQTWAAIAPLISKITTVEVDLTSSGTSCNESASVALNGTFDTLIRNQSYAILGYECGTTGGTLNITGADTGNTRVGGPLYNQTELTAAWFVFLSQQYGLPLIPVINSANVAAVNLTVEAQATSASFKVALNLALLSQTLPSPTS